MTTHTHKKSSFGSKLGFVLATAGSAVGLGNLWRFPYTAAKDGGGLFLVVYLVLVFTLGYTVMTSEMALGRRTYKSALNAYKEAHPKFGWLGKLAFIVPAIILTYYVVIGGWVLQYLFVFITGAYDQAAQDGYFTSFITSQWAPIVFTLIFLGLTAIIIALGVEKGIEPASKALMPALIVLAIGIAIFSLTLSNTDADGTRTGLDGLAIFVVPNLEGVTVSSFLRIVMDAVGQAFFSLSLAMGIMVTYSSYMRKEDNLSTNALQVITLDTLVAFLAGVMIIPAVFVFMGTDGLSAAGPSLMFISLPKVFAAMGPVVGTIVGVAFFVLVLLAALTSCVSILEVVVAGAMEKTNYSRKGVTLVCTLIAAVGAIVVCLGYNVFYFELTLPNGSTAQILDLFDYVTNSVLMPIIALVSCILFGWVLKPSWVIDEAQEGGAKFYLKGMFRVMIRYIAPILLAVLLIQSALGV